MPKRKFNGSDECLSDHQSKRFLDLLKKYHVSFTSQIDLPIYLDLSQRTISAISQRYIKEIQRSQNKIIFTDIVLHLREDDKHAVALAFVRSSNSLEFFNCNGKATNSVTDQRVLKFVNQLALQLTGNPVIEICSKNINIYGQGHCAAWTLYFFQERIRNQQDIFSQIVNTWTASDIFAINQKIIECKINECMFNK